MTYQYPNEMTEQEAVLYVNRAKRKFGESNIAHISISFCGSDDKNVEIETTLVAGARERVHRLSAEMVAGVMKGA